MRVIVTGSRYWTDCEAIRRRLAELPPDAIVIHGGATGADMLAGDIADELGLAVEVYPANWRVYGKSAGPMRNIKMLKAGADLVLAFPAKDSRGTWDMVRKAQRANVRVVINLAMTKEVK